VGGFSVLDGVRKPCDALSSVGFLGTVGLIAEMVHAHRAGPPVPQYFTLHGGKTPIAMVMAIEKRGAGVIARRALQTAAQIFRHGSANGPATF
jgi:hypothetical protein